MSVEIGYNRRWLNDFSVTDNLARDASDFGTFSVTAPADPRLPDGGGYVVSGLYNVNADRAGQSNDFVTYTDFLPGRHCSTSATTDCCSTSARGRATA